MYTQVRHLDISTKILETIFKKLHYLRLRAYA